MTRRWEASSRLSFSPAMAPGNPKQEDELLYSPDRHFELHGVIMLFVLVAIFSLFILSLVMLPYLKRDSNNESEYSGSVIRQKCPLLWLRKRRRMEDGTRPVESLQDEGEVIRKSP